MLAPSKTYRHDVITFSNGLEIEIVHNFRSREGFTNSLYAAAHSWLVRADEWTPESLARYINSKGVHTAYTVEEYERLTGVSLS